MAGGWKSLRIDEIEPVAVLDGSLLWRPLRRTLGVEAFGINAYTAPNVGDDVVEEHTEEQLGHEEVYVVLSGRATFALDGETLDAPAGTAVFVSDPAVRRHAKAAEADTAVLAIGGPRGAAYTPSAWEIGFAAERHRATGDLDAMVDEIAAGLERFPEHPGVLYRLACAETLAGRTDDALGHIARAVALRPDLATYANEEPDLAPLRGLPGFPTP
jgi:hypothetical protein